MGSTAPAVSRAGRDASPFPVHASPQTWKGAGPDMPRRRALLSVLGTVLAPPAAIAGPGPDGAPRMSPDVLAQLAPTGVLRAGVNLSNFLLVTGRTEAGDPVGVSPDMARAIAERLGVPVRYVTYPRPNALADAAGTGAWDIGLIGAEPQRAEKI